MSFMEKNRVKGDGTEHTALKLTWEGEIYGAGMFEALAENYPELADKATAVVTMEWLNVHLCEEFGHARGMSVSVELAEKLGREGAKDVEKHSIETLTKVPIAETPAMDKLYEELGKHASSPELKDLADNLIVHEHLTDAGRTFREEIEVRTDELEWPILDALCDEVEELLDHLDGWSEAIMAAGSYPKRIAGVTKTGGAAHLGPGPTIDTAAAHYQQG